MWLWRSFGAQQLSTFFNKRRSSAGREIRRLHFVRFRRHRTNMTDRERGRDRAEHNVETGSQSLFAGNHTQVSGSQNPDRTTPSNLRNTTGRGTGVNRADSEETTWQKKHKHTTEGGRKRWTHVDKLPEDNREDNSNQTHFKMSLQKQIKPRLLYIMYKYSRGPMLILQYWLYSL